MEEKAGFVQWDELFPPTNIRIKVDANDGKHISSTIHELLHIILYPMHCGHLDDELIEVDILAYERFMDAYVGKSARRLQTWTQAIDAKLAPAREQATE